jgi:threonine/homoserine/homoserine lactone efflux protein
VELGHPKVAVFFLALFRQFLDRRANTASQSLVLGLGGWAAPQTWRPAAIRPRTGPWYVAALTQRQRRATMHLGRLLLRLAIGSTFFVHGTQKLFGWFGGYGPDGTGQFFEGLGLRPVSRRPAAAR